MIINPKATLSITAWEDFTLGECHCEMSLDQVYMMQLHISLEKGSDNLILESNQNRCDSSFTLLEKKGLIYKNVSRGQFLKKFKDISKKKFAY